MQEEVKLQDIEIIAENLHISWGRVLVNIAHKGWGFLAKSVIDGKRITMEEFGRMFEVWEG